MRFWRFTKGFFISEIREIEVFFWSIIFPLILYFFLSAVLGSSSRGHRIGFELGVVRNDSNPMRTMLVDQTLSAISADEGIFNVMDYPDAESALQALKSSKADLIAVIGGDFDGLTSQTELVLHYLSGKESSEVAANILEIAFDKASIEVSRSGNPGFREITSGSTALQVSAQSRSIDYKDYIFPSVALMMILSVALFNSPIGLSYHRTSGINSKLFTTPLRIYEYFGAHLAKLLFTMLISLTLLYLMAHFIYNVRSGIFSPAFFLALLLGMCTFVSFGLMIASMSSKESSAVVFGQVFYQIMMFLGGFFFPVFGLPWGIRVVVYVLPSTYLVELLRRSMGVSTVSISLFWLITVPLVWMFVSLGVFSLNFRKVMGHD